MLKHNSTVGKKEINGNKEILVCGRMSGMQAICEKAPGHIPTEYQKVRTPNR